MKNIFTKIEFHYSFLIVALGLVITGHFCNLLIFTSLILVHESGHVLSALFLKYKVDKIIIYPYGGNTKLNTYINNNIYKEFVVAIFGLFFQCIYFIVIHTLYSNGIIRQYIYDLFLLYHSSMLIFNLLPIIPLDGFKILNLFFSKFLNFNFTNNLSVFISLFAIIFLIFTNTFENNYSFILVLGILMKNIYQFYNNISYTYNRFMLERYLYNINYKRVKIIKDENKMYKNKSHFIIKNGKIINEKQFLEHFFCKR